MPSPLSPLDANLIRCDDWPNESDNLIRRAVNESDKVTKPPPPPSTPTPPPPTPSATPPTAMATTSSLAGRSEAALFGGGQAAFIAIQCLDVSVASLGSWAALAAVVSASLTSLLSKRAPGPPPSISEFDVAPAVARAVKILNLAAALLHRVRSGDAALTLRLGLSLWLGGYLLRPFSLFTLAWAAFTVAAGLPLVPNHREKVDEARAAAAAAVITWAALARAKVSAVTGKKRRRAEAPAGQWLDASMPYRRRHAAGKVRRGAGGADDLVPPLLDVDGAGDALRRPCGQAAPELGGGPRLQPDPRLGGGGRAAQGAPHDDDCAVLGPLLALQGALRVSDKRATRCRTGMRTGRVLQHRDGV